MISNPGFSFSNHVGNCSISLHDNTELIDPTSLYSELVTCAAPTKLKSIYSHNTNNSLRSNSIVLKFSSIDINSNQAILDFCNEYGLINSQRHVANHTVDYIFYDQNKADFSKEIHLYQNEKILLADIKKAIVSINLLIKLSDAIDKITQGAYNKQNSHSDTIVEIISYFCFDLTIFDYPDSSPASELFRFNHAFYRHAEKLGYEPFDYKDIDYSEMISSFLGYLIGDAEAEKEFHSRNIPYPRKYVLFDHTEWRHLNGLFRDLLSENKILSVSPFGEVTFAKPLAETNYLQSLNINNLIHLAKAVLSDLFKENLQNISLEIQFQNGQMYPTWRVPTLLSAMYLELFFYYSPNRRIRLCADPTCNAKFEWSSSKPTQIYCCVACGQRVAKRMERERKKEEKAKKS